MQVPPFHTAEEMRAISDLVHQVEGLIVGVTALLVLGEAGRRIRNRLLWPGAVCLAGLFLLAALLAPHHGWEHARAQWVFVFGDAQQRQHLAIAALVTLGGVAEILHRSGGLPGKRWAFVWPLAVAGVGAAFLLHTQHGTGEAVARAVLVHRLLAAAFIATALLRAAEVLKGPRAGFLRYAWGVTLLVAAGILFAYREPPGAYAGHEPAAASPQLGNGSEAADSRLGKASPLQHGTAACRPGLDRCAVVGLLAIARRFT
ncbi:hypothetical protein [Longimicrobium sp.]|uniref:hypothetical protein n=1 Tax=Longimicrobium sp. TaxID=2029185 RepID=UPI002E355D8B|nr:hypothetical protein [Longimicrobium sp.]HEX6041623.1 hypothetical protein [Longimicrobium sp.]